MTKINLTGNKFNRLTVTAEASKSKTGLRRWMCICSCGNVTIVHHYGLTRNITKSCGCLNAEMVKARFITHGKSKSSEYSTWESIIIRCTSINFKQHKNYLGRGITVCDRWRNSFESFLADMGSRPSPKHQIDRIDNNGNYEPGNCRWVERIVNMRNMNKSMWWDIHGKRYESVRHAAESVGLSPQTIRYRIKHGVPGYSSELKYP